METALQVTLVVTSVLALILSYLNHRLSSQQSNLEMEKLRHEIRALSDDKDDEREVPDDTTRNPRKVVFWLSSAFMGLAVASITLLISFNATRTQALSKVQVEILSKTLSREISEYPNDSAETCEGFSDNSPYYEGCVKMLKKSEGICFLSNIEGQLVPIGSEQAKAEIQTKGDLWELHWRSAKPLFARAHCIKFSGVVDQ